MKVGVTSCAIVMLLAAVAASPVEAARPPGARQRTEPQRPIRVPENLPPPVGEEMRVQAADLDSVLGDENVVLLDVREPWELQEFGTREGYINIPLGELEDRLDELPKGKTILTA